MAPRHSPTERDGAATEVGASCVRSRRFWRCLAAWRSPGLYRCPRLWLTRRILEVLSRPHRGRRLLPPPIRSASQVESVSSRRSIAFSRSHLQETCLAASCREVIGARPVSTSTLDVPEATTPRANTGPRQLRWRCRPHRSQHLLVRDRMVVCLEQTDLHHAARGRGAMVAGGRSKSSCILVW
jgi:hypothetical protein